jgi:hypothetical protein
VIITFIVSIVNLIIREIDKFKNQYKTKDLESQIERLEEYIYVDRSHGVPFEFTRKKNKKISDLNLINIDNNESSSASNLNNL